MLEIARRIRNKILERTQSLVLSEPMQELPDVQQVRLIEGSLPWPSEKILTELCKWPTWLATHRAQVAQHYYTLYGGRAYGLYLNRTQFTDQSGTNQSNYLSDSPDSSFYVHLYDAIPVRPIGFPSICRQYAYNEGALKIAWMRMLKELPQVVSRYKETGEIVINPFPDLVQQ